MIYCETNNYFFPVSVKEIFLYKLDFWVRNGGHVDHVSACIEHDVALKRVVMYPHAIEHVSSYIEHGPSFCALWFYCTSDEKRSCFLTYIVGNAQWATEPIFWKFSCF